MMITAGVDVGAATAKTVIVADSKILSHAVIPTGDSVARAAERVTAAALDLAGLSMSDLRFIISTGYGRNGVAFANRAASEIICHAKGVNLLIPRPGQSSTSAARTARSSASAKMAPSAISS
jgi:activator of 2-hydroxyglutaryl-CoA dehydratase